MHYDKVNSKKCTLMFTHIFFIMRNWFIRNSIQCAKACKRWSVSDLKIFKELKLLFRIFKWRESNCRTCFLCYMYLPN